MARVKVIGKCGCEKWARPSPSHIEKAKNSICLSCSVKSTAKRKIPIEDEKRIVKKYKSLKTMEGQFEYKYELREKYNVTRSCIKKLLKRNNLHEPIKELEGLLISDRNKNGNSIFRKNKEFNKRFKFAMKDPEVRSKMSLIRKNKFKNDSDFRQKLIETSKLATEANRKKSFHICLAKSGNQLRFKFQIQLNKKPHHKTFHLRKTARDPQKEIERQFNNALRFKYKTLKKHNRLDLF